MFEIINLTTFEKIKDLHQEQFNGVTAMFVYQRDVNGNPTSFDVKQYHAEPAAEQA